MAKEGGAAQPPLAPPLAEKKRASPAIILNHIVDVSMSIKESVGRDWRCVSGSETWAAMRCHWKQQEVSMRSTKHVWLQLAESATDVEGA